MSVAKFGQENESSITIVTAFFDIGRGNIPDNQGYPTNMKRTNETYFNYFSHLATLNNDMIIFTSEEFKEKVLALRRGRKTQVITLDLNLFHREIETIGNIQQDEGFKSKVNPPLLKNIEYWSPAYVLVNNLKTFFVNYAIRNQLVQTDLVAWIDFGYVRNKKTLSDLKVWRYPFSAEKIHFFTIKASYPLSAESDVYHAIFNNEPYIIGGVIVSGKATWLKFYSRLRRIHRYLLKQNIMDDDQGVYLMSVFKYPELFLLNFLGKDDWFALFRKYSLKSGLTVWGKIKNLFK